MDGAPVAFVLGGGGVRGAVEVGMPRALLDAGVRPDLVVGTSIGAINGALVAADPTPGVVDALVLAPLTVALGVAVLAFTPVIVLVLLATRAGDRRPRRAGGMAVRLVRGHRRLGRRAGSGALRGGAVGAGIRCG
ncbi:patatin-like phospholipase family protein [Microbacterium telephonicum]|uniref:Patatin-like phospholipase n=1 Tax=Microbacterium telephonicum TaxID=1714841 RepID=A0A498CAE2_9MICO|nr:patatin-like phospholipase [Microbacterium telephonicum]